MSQLFTEKGLDAHQDKTCFVVFGSGEYKEEINKQLVNNPLYLGDFQIKRKDSDRYLGQILHTDGVRASCMATIKDREGKINAAAFEVQSIIDDFRMQAIGGMMAAFELWERAMVPSLLSGAGTWVGITSTEEERLDKIQEFFWRVMFKVPESCPRIALRAETGMMGMKHRVWLSKLLLLKRIKSQTLDTLSRKILEEQWTNQWPGLSREVAEICDNLDIPNINENSITVGKLKTAVFDHHYKELKDKISKSKKMMKHTDEDFSKPQDYLNEKSVENSRMAFRIRCEMVQDIRGNYKDKYRRQGGEIALECQDCLTNEIQTQSHCLICPRWEKLREGLELNKLEDMVKYFQKLLSERMKSKSGSH